jgi:FKBP-type peptidyl-prolyl cis-trans isomerase
MNEITFGATILIAVSALALAACGPQGAADGAVDSAVTQGADTGVTTTDDGGSAEVVTELQITDVEQGDGAAANPGQQVVVHYTGWLYEPGEPDNKGTKFDSSVDRDQPFAFPLGAGRVIAGWDTGVAGMQVGGKRVLIIPPDMAYGDRGAGGVIPPNATLLFEVELLEVQ